MSNEVTFNLSMHIRKVDASGNELLKYTNDPSSFRIDMSGTRGATPGGLLITTAGVNVDLSLLSTPGIITFYNLGDDYTYDVGAWDADDSRFYPLFQVAPHTGGWPMYLSARLAEEYGTGTGTEGAGNNALRVKAIGGSTYGRIDAFEA